MKQKKVGLDNNAISLGFSKIFSSFTGLNVLLTRFADDKNSKLPRFDSKFLCPRSEAVNVFLCNWHGEINWLCPPIYSIGDTLKHAAHC